LTDALRYLEPSYEARPVVSFDETNNNPTPTSATRSRFRRERVARTDCTYRRGRTHNLFVMSEPQIGWRHVVVTKKRTKVEFVEQKHQLIDEHYLDTEHIRVGLDNFSTQTE
jgi:hypothetical protein